MRGLNQSGFCSYDPGFANTAGCQSAISWIDTENSVLLHRGYPVDQLARQCDFLEVAYIMLNGDAPDEASYQTFRETITRHTLVHEQIARMCSGFRRDSHPMALMCAPVGRWRRSIMMYWMWKIRSTGRWPPPGCCRKCPLSPP